MAQMSLRQEHNWAIVHLKVACCSGLLPLQWTTRVGFDRYQRVVSVGLASEIYAFRVTFRVLARGRVRTAKG